MNSQNSQNSQDKQLTRVENIGRGILIGQYLFIILSMVENQFGFPLLFSSISTVMCSIILFLALVALTFRIFSLTRSPNKEDFKFVTSSINKVDPLIKKLTRYSGRVLYPIFSVALAIYGDTYLYNLVFFITLSIYVQYMLDQIFKAKVLKHFS